MKIKRFYIFLSILISIILFSVAVKCNTLNPFVYLAEILTESDVSEDLKEYQMEIEVTGGFEQQEMEIAHMESLERKWKEKKENSIKDIKNDLAQQQSNEVSISSTEEDDTEQITYYGNIEGINITMIIDFHRQIIRGTISEDDGTWYIKAPIIHGNLGGINEEIIYVEAEFDGIIGHYPSGRSEPFCGHITGEIHKENMSTFKGTFIEYVENISIDFVAQSK
jgi:hypothetical protein